MTSRTEADGRRSVSPGWLSQRHGGVLAGTALAVLLLAACSPPEQGLPGLPVSASGLCNLVDFRRWNKTLHKPVQWYTAQLMDRDRLELLTDPGSLPAGLPPGYPCAFKFTVKPGDTPVAGDERSELAQSDLEPLGEGTELYYRWSTLFDPATLPSGSAWTAIKHLTFTQLHQQTIGGAPPIELVVRRSIGHPGEYIMALVVRDNPTIADQLWARPIKAGRWYDFVLHVRNSTRNGLVELWYDGEHLKQTPIQTLYPDDPNVSLKQGLYRNVLDTVSVVYHSPMVTAGAPEQVGIGPGGTLLPPPSIFGGSP